MPMKWDGKLYDKSHSFVSAYGAEVLDMLGDIRGKSVLDAGCGTGKLTIEAFRRGARVVGADADENMLEIARKNYPRLRFVRRDILSLGYEEEFDAVFSNAVLHWIKDQRGALSSLFRALKGGGVLAAEMGGTGNAARVLGALDEAMGKIGKKFENDFTYCGLEYAALLKEVSFTVAEIRLFERMTPLTEGGLRDWIRQFCPQALESAGEKSDYVLDYVEEKVKSDLFFDSLWHVDYMRLRFKAIKEK